MSEEIRIWSISADDRLVPVNRVKLDLENRIENWLTEDISVLDGGLLVIGRQVSTGFGFIDLLCLDSQANTVIVELKRDMLPRSITAQVLDYASWVKDLSKDKILAIAADFLPRPLEQAFLERFKVELPSVVNKEHSMRVVGSEIDASTERIIEYLSDTYGVNINAATFGFFKKNEEEFLARTFLVEPSAVKRRVDNASRRGVSATNEELQAMADQYGVGPLFTFFRDAFPSRFERSRKTASITLAFDHQAIINLLPCESSSEDGFKVKIDLQRLSEHFRVEDQGLIDLLPKRREPDNEAYFFRTENEVRRFIDGLSRIDTLRRDETLVAT